MLLSDVIKFEDPKVLTEYLEKNFDPKEKIIITIKNDKSEYEIALINALRRILLVDLVSVNIDRDSVKFYENTSVFCDDFLTHRLSLLPLQVEELLKMNIEEIEILCDVKNDDVTIVNVCPKDFKVLQNDKEINNKKIFILEDCLFARLKYGQRLSFSCQLKKGTSKKNTSAFSLVSKAVYYFERDEKQIKEEVKKIKMKKKEMNFYCYIKISII